MINGVRVFKHRIDGLPSTEVSDGPQLLRGREVLGEIGGDGEETAAAYIKESTYPKPVFGFIAGLTAPKGKRMGHAGAIISGSKGRGEDKIAALEDAGVKVIHELGMLGETVARCMRG